MVVGVDRNACHVVTWQDSCPLLPLLGTVMARLAKALEIGRIEEQNLITPMRLDVVDSVGCLDGTQRTTEPTRWLGL